jgi:mannose-6-phosphate isomerase
MGQLIEKPWGSEEILEINDHYMVKRLKMKEMHQCSLQRHRFKHETFVVISGTMGFICEDENGDLQKYTLGPGDSRAIPPGTVHRMIALSDIEYIESSTPHPDDVIRLEDSYGR